MDREQQKAYISNLGSEVVDAESVAKLLDAKRTIVAGEKISFYNISEELAEELWRLIDFVVLNENCVGYAIVNGESIVFQKGLDTIIAFVDGQKIMGSIRRLSENA